MVRIEDFMSAIGKQADSDVVASLLKEFDLGDRVFIKRGETDVYLNSHEKGVSFLFESERYIHSKYGASLPTDAPVLTAVFLYGQNDDEFSEYQGELLGGLGFTDSQEIAAKKLGKSTKFNPDRHSEFWDLPNNLRIFVRYVDDNKAIARMQFGILWR